GAAFRVFFFAGDAFRLAMTPPCRCHCEQSLVPRLAQRTHECSAGARSPAVVLHRIDSNRAEARFCVLTELKLDSAYQSGGLLPSVNPDRRKMPAMMKIGRRGWYAAALLWVAAVGA